MPIIDTLASTFSVSPLDIYMGIFILLSGFVAYRLVSLHSLYEVYFGMIMGIGIYVLLFVLLVANEPVGTAGGLFPFGFASIVISILVYGVFFFPVLFVLHGGLVVSEPETENIYKIEFFVLYVGLAILISSILIYMIDQIYIFRVGTGFVYLRDLDIYTQYIQKSYLYVFAIEKQNILIPLAVILFLYKVLLSNIVSAALLSIWYNLSHIGFYRNTKPDNHYRVEFHEVGENTHTDDHGDHGHSADTHAPSHGGHH